VFQVLSAVHATVALVGVPFSFTKLIGALLLAPPALFQLALATTPAASELPIAVVLVPLKSMLIAPEELPDVTTSVTEAAWFSAPLAPVIVNVELPIGVLPVVVMVSVEEPELVTDAGLNEAVAPVGNPLELRFTVPVNPFNAAIVTV
jgi:hypothetical protein